MKTFTRTWFQSGKTLPALARHWIKEGYLKEASWLGASMAWKDYQQYKAELESARELLRQEFFRTSKERINKEKFLARLRACKVMGDHGKWDVVERFGENYPVSVVPDREDHSDIAPQLCDDPYYRQAS